MRLHRGWRLLVLVPIIAVVAALIIWHGPDWHLVHDAFAAMNWEWVVAAVGLNLLSVIARSLSWDTTIKQSIEPPFPKFGLVFSAFSVGLFANVVLPGRVGELARAAVLRRHLPPRKGTTATLIGSVFAHRMFDLVPAALLVIWVLLSAKIPGWALASIAIVLGVGALLFLVAIWLARRQHRELEGLGGIRQLIVRGRQGLAVMRRPVPALKATSFQTAGWICQLFAVWSTMFAFDIHVPIAAAGLVLVLINVATIVTLWPGNFGFVQAAIALPLVNYGVQYGKGFAFGIGLQAVEASVGVGVGLVFLAREGLSYAMLKEFEEDQPEASAENVLDFEEDAEPARTRVTG